MGSKKKSTVFICVCHGDNLGSALLGTGQHADRGTFPEWENHLDATLPSHSDAKTAAPVTSENLSTVRAQAGNPSSIAFEPWDPLSPGSAQRHDKPLSSPQRLAMLILDDLMQESAKSPQIIQLLMRSSHHLDLFTITLLQNLYSGG